MGTPSCILVGGAGGMTCFRPVHFKPPPSIQAPSIWLEIFFSRASGGGGVLARKQRPETLGGGGGGAFGRSGAVKPPGAAREALEGLSSLRGSETRP
jgi:hypothetical protein